MRDSANIPMRVLITGSKGQLGYELQRSAPEKAVVLGLDLPDLDVSNEPALQVQIQTFKPTIVINAAAYTAVDKAESEQALSYKINCDSAQTLARLCKLANCRLLHVSTDFVFDGALGRVYLPEDPISPLSIYGKSKAQGEAAVLATYPENSLIVRTAWVYSAHGGNFVKSILKLLREREQLGIIADQVGTPTWAASLAKCLWTFASRKETGLWHFTDAGVASWYDYAVAIAEEGHAIGLIEQIKPILPIRTQDYPTPAKRPSLSILDKTQTWAITGVAPHWRSNLRKMLAELKAAGF
jgi:dTDP-4-dehydrorhamnose reductase